MSFAEDLENKVLDHVFGGGDYTRLANVYVALSTTTIANDGTGMTEPSGGSYARKLVANNATNWPAAASGAKANAVPVAFVTTTGSWGVVIDFAIMSALSGGVMLGFGTLTASKTIDDGDTPSFAIGAFNITLT